MTRAEQEKKRLKDLAAKGPTQKATVPNIKAPESNNSVKVPEAKVANSNNPPVLAQTPVPTAVPSVPAVTPAAPVVDDFPDYETWKAKNPTKNSLEYAYEVTQPKPKPVDPEKEKRDRKMSSLVDLGSLLIETGGVAAGGKAFNRTTTATGEVDAKYQRLHDLYTRQRENYSAGKMQSIYRDLANDKQGYMQARQEARMQKDAATERSFRSSEANKSREHDLDKVSLNERLRKALADQAAAEKDKTTTKTQKFTSSEKAKDRSFKATETDKTRKLKEQEDEKNRKSREKIAADRAKKTGAGVRPSGSGKSLLPGASKKAGSLLPK